MTVAAPVAAGGPAGLFPARLRLRGDRAPDEVGVRDLTMADAHALRRMVARCSPEVRYRRFHGVLPAMPAEMALSLCEPRAGRRALGAFWRAGGDAAPWELAAETRYDLLAPGTAECALLVEDALQRRRLGLQLFFVMAAAAAAAGVRLLRCEVLPGNLAIRGLLDRTRLPQTRTLGGGIMTIDLSLPRELTAAGSPPFTRAALEPSAA